MDRYLLTNPVFILTLLLSLHFFSATSWAEIDVGIDVEDSFSEGERIFFDYTISSDSDERVDYVASVYCPEAPIPLLQLSTANVTPVSPLRESFGAMKVTGDIEPQECSARVSILLPEESSFSEPFRIDTRPSFEFRALLCRSFDCLEKSRVFLKGSIVHFSYDSEQEGVSIEASLTYPDGRKSSQSIPGTIIADKKGIYLIEMTVSKPGFKSQSISKEFAVIERDVRVRASSSCNVDGRCGEGEDSQECPQDCPVRASPGGSAPGFPFMYLIVPVVISLSLLYFMFRR